MSRTIEILDRLVAFDTVSHHSNLGLIAYVEDVLETCGFRQTRLTDPTGTKAGIFAAIGPAGPGVLLSAHTDVVPVEGQEWTRDPFRLHRAHDRLYGRGTTDMKGFLASMLAAAERAASLDLAEPLKLAISYDEEIGCIGIAQMIDGLIPAIGTPRAAIVGEPTEMQVATGHKGKVALRAVCNGEAGHSALAPRFTNAIYVATDFVAQIRDVQAEIVADGARDPAYDVPYSTLHVGTIAGGTALNIVPDRVAMAFELRHLAADVPSAILPRLAMDGVEITETNAYPGLETSDIDVVQLGLNLTETNHTTKVAFGTEAGYFDALGIPTIVCGPGSMAGQGHKADEFITCEQLEQCGAMMDRLLVALSA